MINTGNTSFRGRYLFAGTETEQPPFVMQDMFVRYNGNQNSIDSYIDRSVLMANNIDGHAALGALTEPVGTDINPALTLDTEALKAELAARLEDAGKGLLDRLLKKKEQYD